MRLRTKVLFSIISVWGLIIGGVYLGSLKILEKNYSNLEQKKIVENLTISPHHIHLLGKKTIYYFSLTFLVLGVIFSLVLFYLLKFIVIDRLATINKQIMEITSTKNFNIKVLETGSDEISSIGFEINKMLAIIAEIEVLLLNTIDSVPSIVTVVDENFNILNINQFGKNELGFPEISGKSLFNVFPYLADYQAMFNTTHQIQEIDKIRYVNDKNIQYYRVFIYPLKQSGEKKFVIRIDNITETIRMKNILMQHDRLSAIGILTAGVAHEINNPVNFISSSTDPLKRNIQNLFTIWQKYSEIKEGEELELSNKLIEIEKLKQSFDLNYTIDESKQLMKGISDGIHRITIIMKDLKTFSKENEEVMVKADIHQGIDATLTLLKPRYKDRIKIHKNYAKLSEINCYYGKLNQVFMNIISNAIEAIPDKGEIDITTVENDNQIKIIIKDNGLGISESDAKKIFNPFFTTKSLGKGTGLGLSIASSIIQDHKGSIEVESKIGKGAKFTIILPLH